ncbi:hypothetical protein VI08_19465 [Luteibacter yeojuensis]|uniref:Uncharacterized protein n=1 Tax=Luteibacter yeojuensis TaxID=345309 RepID=A0A0F3K6U1_9GAMM|nr:hypothetical protein VI08_19465 [Luteibacter yeojuensis]
MNHDTSADLPGLLGKLLDAGFMLEVEPGYAEAVKAHREGMGALSDAEWQTLIREVRPSLPPTHDRKIETARAAS